MLRKIWKRDSMPDELLPEMHPHTLTGIELKENARKRLATINNEFRHTFKFLRNYPHSVSFFGSARFGEDNPHYIKARSLARRIAKETDYSVVTGGGPGIMEAANRGAYEAGGKSIGMNIILPHEQKINEYLTAHVRFYYFFIRKVALSFAADIYIFFPGGFGTLDEFFEILTLMQTRKIPQAPLICVGKDFWDHVRQDAIAMRDTFKTISPGDENIFHITDDEDEVMDIIKKAPTGKRGVDAK